MKKINPIILELLSNKGIVEDEEIEEFLSEKPQKTYDPFLLHDLEAGVDLILSSIKNKEKICIYGDYDADGITSVTLLMDVLSKLTDDLEYYIPSRFREGYGLNNAALDEIKKRGAKLIVTVDCGSVSYEEVEHAREIGLKIVVTDHHSIDDRQADCILINPKQKSCSYPFKELAGCGVAFKLAQGIQQKAGLPKRDINSVLDMVAIGTIGDIVPLRDENRTLVKYGMKMINSSVRGSLISLIEKISLKPSSVGSEQVAFGIVPNLNAAGRMAHASIAVDLLRGRKGAASDKLIETVKKCNRERKTAQEEAFERCKEIIEEKGGPDDFIIVEADGIHEGIAGIVAGKIKDKYNRPAVIVTSSGEQGEYYKGTGRSIEKIHLYDTLKRCNDLFIRFGGHEGACGFLMKKENLPELKESTKSAVAKMLAKDEKLFEKNISADMVIQGEAVTLDLARSIDVIGPFGKGNNKPEFMIKSVIPQQVVLIGENKNHLRFTGLFHNDNNIQCVLFNKAKEYWDVLSAGKPINIIGNIDWQEWRGNARVQFKVNFITL